MAVTTADCVADYLLSFVHEEGDYLCNLKLQKLVYYAQAWFLALYDEPLFCDKIEAWVHGPAQPALYRRFKDNGRQPIADAVERPTFDDDRVRPHLEEVMQVYGGMSSYQLSLLTHSEDPWKKARGNIAPEESSTAEITQESMKRFYRAVADEQED